MIHRRALLLLASGVSLTYPFLTEPANAASSCDGASGTITISSDETEPCNLSNGTSLTIAEGVTIQAPKGPSPGTDPYGLGYSAVNVGTNDNTDPTIAVDSIVNNGTLLGFGAVTITYSGHVETLLNHGKIEAPAGSVLVAGYLGTLDNYGSITLPEVRNSPSVRIAHAFKSPDITQAGHIESVINRQSGHIDGILANSASFTKIDNYGTIAGVFVDGPAAAAIEMVSARGDTIDNYGTMTGKMHGIAIVDGSLLNSFTNQPDSIGITAESDGIRVTGRGTSRGFTGDVPSTLTEINNSSSIEGKENGIVIDDEGVIGTINNLDGGIIKGATSAINNNSTITDGIYNSGTIDGDIILGQASLFVYGDNAKIINGNISGDDNSSVTFGDKNPAGETVNLSFDGDLKVGSVKIISGSALHIGDGATGGSVDGDIQNNGDLYFNRSDKITYADIISGTGDVYQEGSGTLILTGKNTYTGTTRIDAGILQIGDGGTAGSIDTSAKVVMKQGGVLAFHRTDDVVFGLDIEGSGSLRQQGTNELTLTGSVSTGDSIKVASGKLRFGDGTKIGTLSLAGIENKGSVLVTAPAGQSVSLAGAITGTGTLDVESGTAVLTGDSSYSGTTAIAKGATLKLGDGGATGSLANSDIQNSGTLAFDRSGTLAYSKIISGDGTVEQVGSGVTILSGHNTYTGQTLIKSGTLQFDYWNSVPEGRSIETDAAGTLALNLNGTSAFDGVVTGGGTIKKIGDGVTTISSDSSAFTGSTSIEGGTLVVDGHLGTAASTLTVKSGGSLDGIGTIAGTTTIEAGGHLLGKQGDTLTIGSHLVLADGSNVDISLGAEDASAAELFDVKGNLTLDGSLNVSDLGGFGAGEYNVFRYGGTLTDNGMNLTGGIAGALSLDTTRANEVYLVNTAGMILNYWDGGDSSKHNNGIVDGGDGVWRVGGESNWTSKIGQPNTAWDNSDQFAVFAGTGGTVQVNNDGGNVTVNGMQFSVDGYTISGASLALENDDAGSAKVRVGNGSKSSADTTAVIESVLTGAATLETTDYGKLILTGENEYTGGTKATRGILQIGDGGTKGSIKGDVETDSEGTIAFNHSDDVTFSGIIQGKGQLIQAGSGTLVLTGANTMTGGTLIGNGTLQIGDGGTAGSLEGIVDSSSGTKLVFNRFDQIVFSGIFKGDGQLVQAGTGTLVLTGNNIHQGGTLVQSGTLQLGQGGDDGSLLGDITDDGTVAFGFDGDTVFTGNISGSGSLTQIGKGRTVLLGDNLMTGGTTVSSGILQVGGNGTEGSLAGNVSVSEGAALAFSRSDTYTFAGIISGAGDLQQDGSGVTVLTGPSSYTGTTQVDEGTLRQGIENAFSTSSIYNVGRHGVLDMGGFSTTLSALNNSGLVMIGGSNFAGRTLTVNGDYQGDGGTVNLSTVLGDDNSKTDRLVVSGNTSGSSHLAITNIGGAGAQTVEGIKVVDVQGASNGSFSLVGDYSYKGDPAVVAGAYSYRLYKNGTNNADGDWYLRSSLTNPAPEPTPGPTPDPSVLYNPGVSVYEAYGKVLQTLNAPLSLRERTSGREAGIRNRSANSEPFGEGDADEDVSSLPNGVWGRMTASYGKLAPKYTTSGAGATTYNLVRATVGLDGRFHEDDQGELIGGVYMQYSNIDAKVGSIHGDGKIRANGYTVGATGTWYGQNGFYFDGLAQFTYFSNDLESETANRNLGDGKSALGYAVSLETGKNIDLGLDWSLTPQIQLIYSSVDKNDFHDPFGAEIGFDRSENMRLRLGMTVDYNRSWNDGPNNDTRTARVYGLLNIHQELLGHDDLVDISDVSFISADDRTWGEIGIGGSYSWNEAKYSVYGQTSVNTSLNHFANSYELSAKLGIRASW